MSKKSDAARIRIDNTKTLSLDQRIVIITQALSEVGCAEISVQSKRLCNWLEAHNYEPMMFKHAYRIFISRQRP